MTLVQHVLFAEEIKVAGNIISFPVPVAGKNVMAVFVDVYGNEARELISAARFRPVDDPTSRSEAVLDVVPLSAMTKAASSAAVTKPSAAMLPSAELSKPPVSLPTRLAKSVAAPVALNTAKVASAPMEGQVSKPVPMSVAKRPSKRKDK